MNQTSPLGMLRYYANAGYPAVCVETYEEMRVVRAVLTLFPDRPVSTVDASQTLTDQRGGKQTTANFSTAFKNCATEQNEILIAFDFRHVINSAAAYRPLLAALPAAKSNHVLFILVGPAWNLPEELKHEIPVLQIALPSPDELAAPLAIALEGYAAARAEAGKPTIKLTPEKQSALTQAARGLTLSEAENAFSLAACANGFSPAYVEREKMRLVRSDYMTVENHVDPATLGGLDNLKDYIRAEVTSSQNDPALAVRGILLVGVPGTGKSLAAKATAALLQWPLIRLDLGAAKGSLVGQSEGNIRAALRTADAVSPCVLWLDEIEKGVGGYASSSQTDGGTTLAMVGTLLTWMQEHTSPVIVVATCNDYAKLPPELARARRFDERFFLDLPSTPERIEIAAIHLARLNCNIAPEAQSDIPALTRDFTGAEIEQLIISAARRTSRKITGNALRSAAAEIIPIARTSNIKELRDWAATHLRRANTEEPKAATVARKIGGHFDA